MYLFVIFVCVGRYFIIIGIREAKLFAKVEVEVKIVLFGKN